MRRALYTPVSMVLFALAVASCGGKQQIANAETAVTQFHAQLNAGNFDQIYTDSDAAMKNASSQEKFVALLDAIHRKLGAVKSANRQSFFMNYGTSGKFLSSYGLGASSLECGSSPTAFAHVTSLQ